MEMLVQAVSQQEIVEGIRAGFEPTHSEIVYVLVLVGGLVLLLIAGAFVQGRLERTRLRRASVKAFEAIARKSDLTLKEYETLKRLAQCLPETRERPHLLAADAFVFSRAASKAVKDGTLSREQIGVLRRKLGLGLTLSRTGRDGRGVGAGHSSPRPDHPGAEPQLCSSRSETDPFTIEKYGGGS